MTEGDWACRGRTGRTWGTCLPRPSRTRSRAPREWLCRGRAISTTATARNDPTAKYTHEFVKISSSVPCMRTEPEGKGVGLEC